MERKNLESAARSYAHMRGLLSLPLGILLFVAALDEALLSVAAQIALSARSVGRAEFALRARKPGAAAQDAAKKGARFLALVGSDEAARGTVSLKDLESGETRSVLQAELNEIVGGSA